MAHTFLFPLEQKEFMAGTVVLALYLDYTYLPLGDPLEFPKPCVYLAPNCSGCLYKVISENYLTLLCFSLGGRILEESAYPHRASQQQRKMSKPLNDCIIRTLCPVSGIRMKGQTPATMSPAL